MPKKKTSREYWAERARIREAESQERENALKRDVKKIYDRALKNITDDINAFYVRYGKENCVSPEDARKIMSLDEHKVWVKSLEEYVEEINKETDPLTKTELKARLDALAYNSRITRLEGLKEQISLAYNEFYVKAENEIKTGLENSFETSLQQRAYDISKGCMPKIRLVEKLFDKGLAEKVVLEPWYGANFSESLWNNKQMLAFNLQKIVTNGMMRGTHPVQMAKELENHSDKSFFACTRLIETETSRIHSEANFEAMKEGGIEYYELLVQDDGCDKCKEWEGKKIPLSKREVGYNAEPLHPFCHCTSIAVDDVDFDTPITPEEEAELDGWKKWIKKQEERYQGVKAKNNSKLLVDADLESELGKFASKIKKYSKGSTKEYYHVLKDKFSHGSAEAKRIFNKYVPYNSVTNYKYEGTAYYINGEIGMHYVADLNNSRGACATWYHEHGHMIDDLAGDASNDDLFVDMLNNDFLDITFEKSYNEIEKELTDMRTQSAVSDLMNGLSMDEIKGVAIHPPRPDGTSYWNDETVRQEAFAHMYECQFDKIRYDEMKKYFPNALAEFERIMKRL